MQNGRYIDKTLAKMGKGRDVFTKVLGKICKALDVKIEGIVEVVSDVSK